MPAAALALAQPLAGGLAGAATPLRLTPAQTEGPYCPVDLPQDTESDLLHHGELADGQCQPSWLGGRVVNLAGQPVACDGRTPDSHVKLRLGRSTLLTTRL